MTIPEGSPELEVIEPISESYGVVEAEMVGYFKFSNGPLKPGTEIHEGDVIGSITALGIVSEVVSPIAGEVTEAMVGDGDPVEYGQPIVRVEVGI
ncbi:MAG: hypothetical protein HONBIEJF_01622 [Fimbriimonadaceae bacterium]|nr:hypothetical protein [Fimbriimonadaceae bacterium]